MVVSQYIKGKDNIIDIQRPFIADLGISLFYGLFYFLKYDRRYEKMEQQGMTEQARLLKNKMLREWRKNNPKKVKQHQVNYWNKKAEQMEEQQEVEQCN